MNLKEQLAIMKLKAKEKANTISSSTEKGACSFIKYKEIIKESLKQNKDIPLYKKFKVDANEYKAIPSTSNPTPSEKLLLPSSIEETTSDPKEQPPLSQVDQPQQDAEQEEETEPFQKKEYKTTIIPSEIIQEIKEQDTTQRVINVDKYSYDLKCNELYNWFHLTFIEWEKELEEILLSDPELAKSRMGIYKQCRGYIKTLLIHLKERSVTKVILDKLFQVMVFSMDGDYIRAHDNYIELSIGNAPWPMGVTMVGIHERSGRSKIYTSQVAYILNDDITKKYLQSVKRIMTFIQRRYPKSPSKCVFS